jgi:tRNA threonylcarbamoyladenosine biosynthesis protein TsaE
MFNINLYSKSVEETISIAEKFIKDLNNKNVIIFLNGDLGAGKTHFTKGIFKGLSFDDYIQVTSPTFDIVNTYKENNFKVNHLDLYRLDVLGKEDEIWLNEIINEDCLTIIEWGNKFEFKTLKKTYFVNIFIESENERRIEISSN